MGEGENMVEATETVASVKDDGESWEAFARRLEARIKEQRVALKSLQELRAVSGDKKARVKIAHLERLVGKKEAQLAHQHDGLSSRNARVRALEAALREIAWMEERWEVAESADELDFTAWFWEAVSGAPPALTPTTAQQSSPTSASSDVACSDAGGGV